CGGDVFLDQYAVGDGRLAVLVVAGQLIGLGGGVEGDRRAVADGAGEQVAAFLVADVGEAEDGGFQAAQLAGHGGQVLGGVAAVGGPQQQVADVEHGVRGGRQVGFLLGQVAGDVGDVGAVLGEGG